MLQDRFVILFFYRFLCFCFFKKNENQKKNCSAEMLSPDCKYIPSKEDPLIEVFLNKMIVLFFNFLIFIRRILLIQKDSPL